MEFVGLNIKRINVEEYKYFQSGSGWAIGLDENKDTELKKLLLLDIGYYELENSEQFEITIEDDEKYILINEYQGEGRRVISDYIEDYLGLDDMPF